MLLSGLAFVVTLIEPIWAWSGFDMHVSHGAVVFYIPLLVYDLVAFVFTPINLLITALTSRVLGGATARDYSADPAYAPAVLARRVRGKGGGVSRLVNAQGIPGCIPTINISFSVSPPPPPVLLCSAAQPTWRWWHATRAVASLSLTARRISCDSLTPCQVCNRGTHLLFVAALCHISLSRCTAFFFNCQGPSLRT